MLHQVAPEEPEIPQNFPKGRGTPAQLTPLPHAGIRNRIQPPQSRKASYAYAQWLPSAENVIFLPEI